MVQDSSLLPALCNVSAGAVKASWYRERNLLHASLLDVCILCVLRTSLHAVFHLGDAYLLSNCTAILSSISSSSTYSSGLHSHTCERLVKLARHLCRRLIKSFSSEGEEEHAVEGHSLLADLFVGVVRFILSSLR
jgi:hypothetical protein